jgi:hypothetical protein
MALIAKRGGSMRLIAIAVLSLVSGFLGVAPAQAQNLPVCAEKARQWQGLRSSVDVDALVRFASTIPSTCTDLQREVSLVLNRLQGATLSRPAETGAPTSGRNGFEAASPGADKPSAPSSSAPSSSEVFGGASANSSSAGDREQHRLQIEAERAAAQQQQQQANAAKAARPAAKTQRPSPPPSPSAGPTIASHSPSVALPVGYQIVSHVLTPTESYLPKRDGMPTGLVLLDTREKSKNQSLCKALLGAHTATVKTDAAARRDNPNGDFLVTHWPVTGVLVHQDDCAELLAKYDFDRAERVKNAYALGGSRGPVFLALDPTGEIVFLDLKDASADAVFKATSDWMKLALASPQNRPQAEARVGLVAGTSRLFGELASGFASLVGSEAHAPTVVKFNDPVKGTSRQFNIYKAGVYLIGATFTL